MSIRNGRRSDHMQLMLLDRKCFDKPVAGITWYDFLDMDVVHVAVDAGAVKGYIVSRHTKSGVRILRMAVAPESRRTGVGSQLIQAVLSSTSARVYALVPESLAFDGVGKFLNSNNFIATTYDNRNRIRFVIRQDSTADPGAGKPIRHLQSAARTG